MPRVKTSKARTDRYHKGILVKDKKTKSGFRRDKSKPDKDDTLFCKKGEKYYWWKFRFGGIRYSLTPPRRSQLTQSGFLSQMYDLMDGDVQNLAYDGIADQIESIKSELEEMRDECQDSLDNMPEHLQESSDSGMLLQERIESLDSSIDNLDMLDPEGWESELEEKKDELDGQVNDLKAERDEIEEADEADRDESLDDKDEEIQEVKDEYESDVEIFKEEKVNEVQESIEECG